MQDNPVNLALTEEELDLLDRALDTYIDEYGYKGEEWRQPKEKLQQKLRSILKQHTDNQAQ